MKLISFHHNGKYRPGMMLLSTGQVLDIVKAIALARTDRSIGIPDIGTCDDLITLIEIEAQGYGLHRPCTRRRSRDVSRMRWSRRTRSNWRHPSPVHRKTSFA
jgi:hypothetical protein